MRQLRDRRFPSASPSTILTIFLLVGCTACGAGTVGDTVPVTSPKTVGGQAVVNRSEAPSSGEVDARRELRALEAAFKGRIGAYAVDTATGKTIAYRSEERFPLLSTFKAVAAAAVLHKARTSDPGLMGRVVRWGRDDLKPNSPITEKHVGDGMTVARLCEAAIRYSDNTAGNMLLKQIGGPAGLTRYFRTLKDPISRLDRWEIELNDWSPKEKRDTTTPVSMARDLRALTVGDALNAKDRARLNGWLIANTTGDARIRAGLPKSWTIGDKTGTGGSYGTANDIAVVWPAKAAAPIVMAIYTNRQAASASRDDKVVAETAAILARGLGKLR
ncbi:class A beta-lactamase [Sphaerimonospora cavernae]|uniref:Beta-lactamase n=1 Tax=Sphaerimonospora cavernae TaxID=1740611 RepID=A0ABV6U0U4_9ACTN